MVIGKVSARLNLWPKPGDSLRLVSLGDCEQGNFWSSQGVHPHTP
ncbi:hypothetical protein D082_18610 [Synechocystis sp. PCC 6714]|nr:hypothetical protein D082_18610 [Synechocystis sp. PCC 6714]